MKPSFASTISALRCTDPRFPWVHPTPEEAEVADLLEEIAELHEGPNDEPDADDQYGTCLACLEPWPCKAWIYRSEERRVGQGRGAARDATRVRDHVVSR